MAMLRGLIKTEAEVTAQRRLIAAAPDLLEALKACQVAVFMAEGSENDEYRAAAAAIDKAEGKGTR